ncbi:hypothetical protein AC578_4127 [Pseudocercospora eumusae]|uniref:Uncharacterized protein n=1 Tax=Pseudocercospora eumusae TaxID=321146 RepID=A0A139HF40_9PEZI|nr:hypothetical protein AC578_4127 [Pseudocercospora eumusae]
MAEIGFGGKGASLLDLPNPPSNINIEPASTFLPPPPCYLLLAHKSSLCGSLPGPAHRRDRNTPKKPKRALSTATNKPLKRFLEVGGNETSSTKSHVESVVLRE